MTLINFQGHFRYDKWFHCLYLKKYNMYTVVSYSGQSSHVSNYTNVICNWNDCYVVLSTTSQR